MLTSGAATSEPLALLEVGDMTQISNTILFAVRI